MKRSHHCSRFRFSNSNVINTYTSSRKSPTGNVRRALFSIYKNARRQNDRHCSYNRFNQHGREQSRPENKFHPKTNRSERERRKQTPKTKPNTSVNMLTRDSRLSTPTPHNRSLYNLVYCYHRKKNRHGVCSARHNESCLGTSPSIEAKTNARVPQFPNLDCHAPPY